MPVVSKKRMKETFRGYTASRQSSSVVAGGSRSGTDERSRWARDYYEKWYDVV